MTHPCFGSKATGAVYPDVFGDDVTSLRKLEVFLKLHVCVSTPPEEKTAARPLQGKLTVAVLEMR